ncbi:MAG TPA: hypothetical protein VFG75_11280 [Gaiella sp.]|nr:hypothetical protein [Gaiella sp.]
MNRRLLLALPVAVVALVPAARAAQEHSQTTAPPPVVDIRVKISDGGISFSPKKAVRGAFARFILLNTGKKAHAVMLGATKRGAGIQTGFHKTVKPNQQTVLLLFLDYRGKVPYKATLPTDKGKPRMQGTFRIT